ncbi:MAG: aspartate/glutamate racemase family protein [Faecalicatena sp.]|uniref:aspartate/glutamate racemase family protein n=1 Tax=Faecalicatena sp. TaxID=2005360 RepID=UPI002586AF33|nr:aspartate/glutamate racemase family protein [Faecalicatena sp.]MCI6467796.1 aspartate/glutamate racemase family protein [Faecalicatena sp.]MDY5619562.1 aspartate/glutamate racemase family protein [Lachnospiraceae bacterium]
MKKSIVILQTSQVSSTVLKNLCTELMPDVKVYQIIDDSLLEETVANGSITKGVVQRMYQYCRHAESLGAAAILNQCSSVGEAVDLIRPLISIPIVKIDEAMAKEAVRIGKRIAMVATVESTIGPSSRLIQKAAEEAGKEIELEIRLVDGAMVKLMETGDQKLHNEMVLGDVQAAAKVNDIVVLAQGSMIVMEPLLHTIPKPVLTSPRLGVNWLKEVIGE